MREQRLAVAVAVWASLAAGPALAGGGPNVHALVGVRIVPAPGEEVASGTVVVRDGLIEAAGAGVTVPADARVWERENLTVYAGFIEPYATLAWPTGDDDEKTAPQGGHDNAAVTPERDMALHADHEGTWKKLRSAGYTTAVLAPENGIFRGRGALTNLGEGSVHENLLRPGVAQYVTLGRQDASYPRSLMGAVALVRQTFYDARWYAQAHDAYGQDPAQERPPYNTALAELGAAALGQETVVFETGDVQGTLRVAGIVGEHGLDALVVGNGEEYQRLDAVAQTGLTHILPVHFPEPPEIGDEDRLTVDLEELRHWDLAPENPQKLLAKDVEVAFTTHELDEPKKIHEKLAQAIERGLDPKDALAALTTTPAKILDVADRLGTVEAGKMANLVVVEGELFTDKPKIREVWIDGRRIELKETKPPEVDPAGSWELQVDAGDQQLPVTFVLEGEVASLTGHLEVQGLRVDFSTVEVSGTQVEIAFDGSPLGMPGTLSFSMEIEGESTRGSGMSPEGPFTFKGRRTSKPDAPEVLR